MERDDPISFQRFVLGRWVGSGNNIWHRFGEAQTIDRPEGWAVRAGVSAWTSPHAAGAVLVYQVGPGGEIHIAAERYYERASYTAIATAAELARSSWGADRVICSPDDLGLVTYAARIGALMVPGRGLLGEAGEVRQVRDAIQLGAARLEETAAGGYGLTVSPACVNLTRDIASWEWKTTADGETMPEPGRDDLAAVNALVQILLDEEGGGGRILG
jgi:hypothetical protein